MSFLPGDIAAGEYEFFAENTIVMIVPNLSLPVLNLIHVSARPAAPRFRARADPAVICAAASVPVLAERPPYAPGMHAPRFRVPPRRATLARSARSSRRGRRSGSRWR